MAVPDSSVYSTRSPGRPRTLSPRKRYVYDNRGINANTTKNNTPPPNYAVCIISHLITETDEAPELQLVSERPRRADGEVQSESDPDRERTRVPAQ